MKDSKLETESFNVNPIIMALFKKNSGDLPILVSDKPYSENEILSEIEQRTELGKEFYGSMERTYKKYLK